MTLQASHPATGDCACCGKPGGQYDDLPFEIHAIWLRSDPAAALAHGPPRIVRSASVESGSEATDTLLQTDFTRALDEMAKHLPQPEDGISDFARMVIANRLPIAIDFAGSQLDDPARRAEFARWLAGRNDMYSAVAVFSRVFSRARHDASWLRPELLPDFFPARDLLPDDFGHRDTAIWMGSLAFGENPLRWLHHAHHMLGPCVAAWAYIDPQAAGEWLELQEGTEHFNHAIAAYVSGILTADPEAAVLWADRISDPRMRLGGVVKSFALWQLHDPHAANAWLETAGFPEAIRDFIGARMRELRD